MAVRKLGKYYQIDYYVGKKRIREILKGVTTKREAEEVERERLRNSIGPIEFKRFEALSRRFLTHPDKQSKKTLDRDLQRFEKHLFPYFGHCKPHDVSSSTVDDYKVRRQRQFAAHATINRELTVLKSIFRFAWKKRKVSPVRSNRSIARRQCASEIHYRGGVSKDSSVFGARYLPRRCSCLSYGNEARRASGPSIEKRGSQAPFFPVRNRWDRKTTGSSSPC